MCLKKKTKAEKHLSLGCKCGLSDFQAWKQLSYLFLGNKQDMVVGKKRLMLGEFEIRKVLTRTYRGTELTDLNLWVKGSWLGFSFPLYVQDFWGKGWGYWLRGIIISQLMASALNANQTLGIKVLAHKDSMWAQKTGTFNPSPLPFSAVPA